MPKIDLSFGVTAIIAICALLSPILTALLNNRHQIKIKRMDERRAADESDFLHRRNIFENYVSAAGACLNYGGGETKKNYGACYATALFYAPQSLSAEMRLLNTHHTPNHFANIVVATDATIESTIETSHSTFSLWVHFFILPTSPPAVFYGGPFLCGSALVSAANPLALFFCIGV